MLLLSDGSVSIADRSPRNYFDSSVTLANHASWSIARTSDTRYALIGPNADTSRAEAVFHNIIIGRPPVLEVEPVAYDLGLGTLLSTYLTRCLAGNTFVFVRALQRDLHFVTDLGQGNGIAVSTSNSYSDRTSFPTDLVALSPERFIIAYDGDRSSQYHLATQGRSLRRNIWF